MTRVFAAATLSIALSVAGAPTPAQAPTAAPAARAAFGEPFPGGVFGNLNPGSSEARVDLGAVLGKKPVVLVYFIPGNTRSEEAVPDVLEAVSGGDVAVYGVTAVAVGADTTPIRSRIEELGWSVPVLMDEDFALGKMLALQTVPGITVIDREGKLRLANAGSLNQDLEYKMKVRDGLARLAKAGTIGTYGLMPRYEPSQELVGKKAPDFVAPADDGVVRKWSTLIDPRKVNVLVYWSVECSHCRKTLPEINDWYKRNGDKVNVVTAAKCDNGAMKVRTKEFTKLYGFTFPTMLDEDNAIFEKYNITATPTMFVVAPDGTVDSVLSTGLEFGPQVEAKVLELLGDERGG